MTGRLRGQRGSVAGRTVRIAAVAALAAATVVPAFAGRAAGQSLSDIRSRVRSIQADLDAATKRLEDLRTAQERTRQRIAQADERIRLLRKRNARLVRQVVERADALYRSGGTAVMEALLESDSFAELSDRAEALSRASIDDSGVFVRAARARAELEVLMESLKEDRAELAAMSNEVEREARRLQARFEAAQAHYDALRRRAARAARASAAVAGNPGGARPTVRVGGMACPVAGPHSFTDTWGAPRSGGRSHRGVDMMAAYGTPVVAVTSGTISFAGYGSSAGYWQVLSGDDGNQYWYMHNQRNIVTGGRVGTGQQIATVGDTGNARGTPHLHFEYHPGGGGAVNPTPLVASICP